MKIRIEINQIEKEVITNVFDGSLENDFTEITKGKFGSIVYFPGDIENNINGYIEIELNTPFVLETLISIKTLVKVFMVTFKSLIDGLVETITKSSWLKDVTSEEFDKDGDKIVHLFSTKDASAIAVKERLVKEVPEEIPEDMEVFQIIGGDDKLVYVMKI